MPTVTPEKRAHLASIGRLGGLTAAVTVDTIARATNAQGKFRQGFLNGHGCSVCRYIPNPTADLVKAERLYRLHFSRLARKRR